MSKKFEFWSTLIIGIIAALSWTPYLIDKLSPNKFSGKIISQYFNFTENNEKIFLLNKISVVSRNKDFFLKDVEINIKFKSSNIIKSTSVNNRLTVFTFEKPKKLLVPDNEFINNLSILPKDEAIVGYLLFIIPYNVDEPVDFIEFNFISYDEKVKKLKFSYNDIKPEKLLFDDTIWETFDFNDPNYKDIINKK